MNIYETFASNLIDEPKTFPLSESSDITLNPIGGDKARRFFERLMEPYSPRLNAGGVLTDEENKALTIRFYAEYVVKNWTGLKDKDGEEIKFSPEVAKTLFSDKKLEGFFSLIVRMSQNEAAFKEKADEADEGNS